MFNNIILKPLPHLLNPSFDGYKLHSGPCQTVSSKCIEHGIAKCPVSEPTCYLYIKMESLQNRLFADPFDMYNFYVFNTKGHLLMFSFSEGYLNSPRVVWQDDLIQHKCSEPSSGVSYFSPTLSFPSSTISVTSNGCGTLNILQTGDRNSGATWVNVLEAPVNAGSVIHSLVVDSHNLQTYAQDLHVLLLSVTTLSDLQEDSRNILNKQLQTTKASTLHIVYWLTFSFDGSKWHFTRERRIAGFKTLEYLALEPSASGVVCLCHDHYIFIYDSLHLIQNSAQESSCSEMRLPKFIFTQNNEKVDIVIKVGSDITKEDLNIEVTDQNIKLEKKGSMILDHRFLHSVESGAVTWKVENERLEINLPKASVQARWEFLFEGGNEGGEEALNEGHIEEIHQRLAHLTSDQWNSELDSERPAFNPGQLEACDDAEEDLILSVIDGSSHETTHMVHLGTMQHLFNYQPEGNPIPLFCLRHDVDGLLWAVQTDKTFDHVATFHAFGYVKASKTMAKFTKAAPDNSYVAIAEVSSHIYIFCQPESLGSELKNRKSGKITTTVARQLVLSLKNHDQVMGFQCTPKAVFGLTNEELFAYSIKE